MLDSIIESGSNGIDLTTVLICSGNIYIVLFHHSSTYFVTVSCLKDTAFSSFK